MEDATFQEIKKYYANQFSSEQKQAFEQKLATDEQFAQQVKVYALMYELIQKEGDRELESSLSQLGEKLITMNTISLEKPKTRRIMPFSRIVYVAAAIVGLLVIILPLMLLNRSVQDDPASMEQLYSENLRLPPAPEARDEALDPWREAYMAGEYRNAIQILNQRLGDTSYRFRSEAFLYLGLSHLALDEIENALAFFSQVSESSFFFADAQWYMALALLRLEKTEEAKTLLTDISSQANHPQLELAKSLLEKLQ